MWKIYLGDVTKGAGTLRRAWPNQLLKLLFHRALSFLAEGQKKGVAANRGLITVHLEDW